MIHCVPAPLPGKDYKLPSLDLVSNTVGSGQMSISEVSGFLRSPASLQNLVYSLCLFFAKGNKKLEWIRHSDAKKESESKLVFKSCQCIKLEA